MTLSEKEAILDYLEFGMMHMCTELEPALDPDAIGLLYETAYLLLVDLDNTMTSHILIQSVNQHSSR